jgi:hypothetical protein
VSKSAAAIVIRPMTAPAGGAGAARSPLPRAGARRGPLAPARTAATSTPSCVSRAAARWTYRARLRVGCACATSRARGSARSAMSRADDVEQFAPRVGSGSARCTEERGPREEERSALRERRDGRHRSRRVAVVTMSRAVAAVERGEEAKPSPNRRRRRRRAAQISRGRSSRPAPARGAVGAVTRLRWAPTTPITVPRGRPLACDQPDAPDAAGPDCASFRDGARRTAPRPSARAAASRRRSVRILTAGRPGGAARSAGRGRVRDTAPTASPARPSASTTPAPARPWQRVGYARAL